MRIRPTLLFMFMILTVGVPTGGFPAEVRIPGTRVSLQPPRGFVPSGRFQGFNHDESGATIVVREIPRPFDVYRRNFSRDAIKERGMSVHEHRRLTVDSFDAILVRAIDASGGTPYEAWILVLGDLRWSVLIIASYPETSPFRLRTAVRDALLSTQWQPAMDIPDFEGLGFEIEASGRLKISSRFPDALVLTEDGRGRDAVDAPILIVSRAAGHFDFGNLEGFSREHLTGSEVVGEVSGVEGRLKSVAGMPGYEMTAEGVEARSGTALSIYQLVLGEDGRIFIIQGFVGPSRVRDFLPEFRAVAESLRPQ